MAGCGNGQCEAGENSGTCPADCTQAVAGNHLCEPGETPLTCSYDCGVVDVKACEQQLCPTQWAACAADPLCGPLVDCMNACPMNDACLSACLAKFGNGSSPALAALNACAKQGCKPKISEVCGDGLCQGSPASCPSDCTPVNAVCGNGSCDAGESSKACPADCGPPVDYFACMAQHCGKFAKACEANASCAAALACQKSCPLTDQWKPCQKNCVQASTLLAAWYGTPLETCAKQHGCQPDLPPYCGDSICQATETEATCQQDCFVPKVCGDGFCEPSSESAANCPADCATCQTTGCPAKPGMQCCKVSGKWACANAAMCDL